MNFSYNDYQNAVARASSATQTPSVKVGFFKLKNDGDEALVRINCASVEDLQFATVHRPVYGKRYEGLSNPFAGISCLAPFGGHADNCPLCAAAAKEGAVVGKAEKKVYVQMLAAYRDPVTGAWTEAQPVVWERPASFSRDIATLLRDGSLKEVLIKITRNGSGKDTRYLLNYAPERVIPANTVPADFSAFNNFNIAKHSYWEKTAQELEVFLTTGSFPEVEKSDDAAKTVASAPVATAHVEAPVETVVAPTPAPAPTASAPQSRTFDFNF